MTTKEPLPHCALCDLEGCNGMPLPGAEDSYIRHAGLKPQAPIMRSAWEHSFMVWCKALKLRGEE